MAFKEELCNLLNKYSMENECDVPDYILADMVHDFICCVGTHIKRTLDWHGCDSICHKAPSKHSVSITEAPQKNISKEAIIAAKTILLDCMGESEANEFDVEAFSEVIQEYVVNPLNDRVKELEEENNKMKKAIKEVAERAKNFTLYLK